MQTSPLRHVHFSELQPILQSHRNISNNVGSTGGKSVVLGSSLNSDYLHPNSITSHYFSHSPHSLGNILPDCGIVLQLRLVASYMLLLRLKTSTPSLYLSFISRVLLVLPMSLYYSLNLNCTPLNVCWLRFARKHAGIPSKQTSLWTSFIPLPLVSPHRLLALLP